MAEPSPAAATDKYFHNKPFVRSKIRTDFKAKLGTDGRFNSQSANNLETLLGYIEADPRVTDIRWMAYMLATAYWETTHFVTVPRPVVHKAGAPRIEAGVAGRATMRVARNLTPITEEDAAGPYATPVKVKKLPDGTARITEEDGEQWSINALGVSKPITKKAKMGSSVLGEPQKPFVEDDGTELVYVGRGYVQLTWWENYASTGVAIGEGLALLFDPERALKPDIAYKVMAHGMITGAGFANGHKLSDYFQGELTDYSGARAMVNGSADADEIAEIAEAFEEMLMENKVEPAATAVAK